MYKTVLFIKSVDNYIEELKEAEILDKKTIKAYTCDLRLFTQWLTNNNKEVVTEEVLSAFICYLKDDKVLKDTTIVRKIMTFKVFFNQVYNNTSIMDNINFIAQKTQPKIIPVHMVRGILAIAEQELLICATEYKRKLCTRDVAILYLIFSTGIRISELTELKIEDIDMSDNTISIKGKGMKSRHLKITSSITITKLQAWLQLRTKYYHDNDFLFTNKNGSKLSAYGIANIYIKYAKEIDIDSGYSINNLRHTFTTTLLENGVDIRDVQKILGHEQLVSTEVYAHNLPNKGALNMFDVITQL